MVNRLTTVLCVAAAQCQIAFGLKIESTNPSNTRRAVDVTNCNATPSKRVKSAESVQKMQLEETMRWASSPVITKQQPAQNGSFDSFYKVLAEHNAKKEQKHTRSEKQMASQKRKKQKKTKQTDSHNTDPAKHPHLVPVQEQQTDTHDICSSKDDIKVNDTVVENPIVDSSLKILNSQKSPDAHERHVDVQNDLNDANLEDDHDKNNHNTMPAQSSRYTNLFEEDDIEDANAVSLNEFQRMSSVSSEDDLQQGPYRRTNISRPGCCKILSKIENLKLIIIINY